ncbi:hypothetical protein OU997_05385 [Pseudomonas sp. SL4(2022)]|uniref:hypothetical protein n=1 Tax=Pseudomonas sp. SL4(2022) TaxID=2994661 RepID=UPI00226FBE21|nr:hypothetical protein [Pseudomonas sp. SL4(2022)]WAC45606.1 hypothetical protein OU997_05385 [Pseudomonas sp. SL4(2022)]
MTTPQIYGLFAMLTVAAIAGLIFYCIGLRTGKGAGYELGHQTAKNYWKKIVCNARSQLGEARDLLDARTREMATLRQCIEQETADHTAAVAKLKQQMHFAENDRENVIRDLTEELMRQYANRLTNDDWLNLKLAAKQLGIAANTFTRSGSNKTNQAAQAHAFITALAERVKTILDQPPCTAQMCEHGITDTDIIEWLNTNADCWAEIDNATLRFDVNSPEEGFEHLRDVLTLAIQQKLADTDSATNTISTWREQEAERAA